MAKNNINRHYSIDPSIYNIGYFSAEIGWHPEVPTYSGGLGILAGDHLRTSAEMGVPIVGVTLLYKRGYFSQVIGDENWQKEKYHEWDVEKHLEQTDKLVSVNIEGQEIKIRPRIGKIISKYCRNGSTNFVVPIVYLDTDIPENSAGRDLSYVLYGKNSDYKLKQEIVLGIGGLKALRALGYTNLKAYHLNEGHAAFLILARYDELGKDLSHELKLETIKRETLFTTHTPVEDAFDRYSRGELDRFLGRGERETLEKLVRSVHPLNMAMLAMENAGDTNGVSRRHGIISKKLLNNQNVGHVTNGIDVVEWTSPEIQDYFDEGLPGWRVAPEKLLPLAPQQLSGHEINDIHNRRKKAMYDHLRLTSETDSFDPDRPLVGFARRFAAYKRGDILFHNIDRLVEVAGKRSQGGPIQFVFAGKSHPADENGKRVLQHVLNMAEELRGVVNIYFLQDYKIDIAKILVQGVDFWLNMPQHRLEASGTSGMKVAVNGGINLSIQDGWLDEDVIVNGKNALLIGKTYARVEDIPEPKTDEETRRMRAEDAEALYAELGGRVKQVFNSETRTMEMRLQSIALGGFFSANRMVGEYWDQYYAPRVLRQPGEGSENIIPLFEGDAAKRKDA